MSDRPKLSPGRIDGLWNKFRKSCIPMDAGPHQISAMKRAFYSGAASAYEISLDIADFDEDAAMTEMEMFVEELMGYANRLKDGLE